MSNPVTPAAAGDAPKAVAHYVMLCLGALGAVLLAELERLNPLTLFALLVGLGGVVGRTRLTPVLFLLVLTLSHLFHLMTVEGVGGMGWGRGLPRPWVFQLPDLLLGAAGLAFVLGHYRLQTLTRHLWPADGRAAAESPRRPWWSLGGGDAPATQRRSASLVSGGEFGLVALTVLLCVALALVSWLALLRWGNAFGLPTFVGRVALLGWLLAVGGYVLAALLGYWRRCRMTRAQGLVALQDMVWRDTRPEQRHLNRDAARARWRAQRKGTS